MTYCWNIIQVIIWAYLSLLVYAEGTDGLLKKIDNSKETLETLIEIDNMCGSSIQKSRLDLFLTFNSTNVSVDIEKRILSKFLEIKKNRFIGILIKKEAIFKVDYDKYCKDLDMESLIALYKHKNVGGG